MKNYCPRTLRVNVSSNLEEVKNIEQRIRDLNSRASLFSELILTTRKNEFVTNYEYGRGIVNLGEFVLRIYSNCPANCLYCYQKVRQGKDSILNDKVHKKVCTSIIFYTNYEKIFAEIDQLRKQFSSFYKLYFNAGENSDSLFLDHITELSPKLVSYFAKIPNCFLELRTKSDNVDNLLGLEHKGKVIIAFSMNPQEIIEELEEGTATLQERITAAKKCQEAGYYIGIRIEPIFHFEGWEKAYQDLLENIFDQLKISMFYSFSLSTFRYTPMLKSKILAQNPHTWILHDEFVPGVDGKYRYFKPIRLKIYNFLVDQILRHYPSAFIYLSSEPENIWRRVLGNIKKII